MTTLNDKLEKLQGSTSKVRFEVYELRKNLELKYLGSRKSLLEAHKLLRKTKGQPKSFLSKEFRIVRVQVIEDRETVNITKSDFNN